MATLTMKSSRRSSQAGLLLLPCLLLLACSAIPALISGDESFVDGGGRKSKMAIGAGKVAADIHGDDDDPFSGCTPHDARASSFSCSKDSLLWPSLYECAINCPCMVNCN